MHLFMWKWPTFWFYYYYFSLNPAASGGKECNPCAAISSSAVGAAAQGQEHPWPFAGFCQPKEGETGRCEFTAKPYEVIKETNTERALCPLTYSVSNEWYRWHTGLSLVLMLQKEGEPWKHSLVCLCHVYKNIMLKFNASDDEGLRVSFYP